jgi:hypothetical protein
MALGDGHLRAMAGQQDFALSPFYQSGGSRPFANYTSVTAATAPPPNSVGYVAPPQQVPTQQNFAPPQMAAPLPNGMPPLPDHLAPPQTTGQGLAPPPTPVAPPAQTPAPAAPQTSNALSPQQDALHNFANSAGMQFQLEQGANALNNLYAARGQVQSGAAAKALQSFGQNTALQNYFMPYMSLLGGQQAIGAQSGAAIAGVGSNFGNAAASINQNSANALGQGAMNIGNANANNAIIGGLGTANMWNTVGGQLGNVASSYFANRGSIPMPNVLGPMSMSLPSAQPAPSLPGGFY